MAEKSILFLEDDPTFITVMSIKLKGLFPGYEIHKAKTVAEALTLLNGLRPELAIIDENLPDGSGKKILGHPALEESVVMMLSSDNDPNLPGQAIEQGVNYFLAKSAAAEPLFEPLLRGLVERKQFERENIHAKIHAEKLQSIRTMLDTLKHEINNPLGAVMGGIYLLEQSSTLSDKEREMLDLLHRSSKRIKEVVEKLSEASVLEAVDKGGTQVFHVPGDKAWDSKE